MPNDSAGSRRQPKTRAKARAKTRAKTRAKPGSSRYYSEKYLAAAKMSGLEDEMIRTLRADLDKARKEHSATRVSPDGVDDTIGGPTSKPSRRITAIIRQLVALKKKKRRASLYQGETSKEMAARPARHRARARRPPRAIDF